MIGGIGIGYNEFDAQEYKAVFVKNGISADSPIVKQILAVAKNAEGAAFDLGASKGYDEGHKYGMEEGRDDALESVVSNLKAYLDLAKSDPQSAAVYFHRATGKHLFEVQQPCLL